MTPHSYNIAKEILFQSLKTNKRSNILITEISGVTNGKVCCILEEWG